MKIKKSILKEYIKGRIRNILNEENQRQEMDKTSKYLLQRLPPLRRSLELLLSNAYANFITGVQLEAPKPSTFKITLTNGIDFYLVYNGGMDNNKFDLVNATFTAQIAGKKYDLSSMSQSQQAMQKLSSQLTLSPSQEPIQATGGQAPDVGAEAFNDISAEPGEGTLPLPAQPEPGEEEIEVPNGEE